MAFKIGDTVTLNNDTRNLGYGKVDKLCATGALVTFEGFPESVWYNYKNLQKYADWENAAWNTLMQQSDTLNDFFQQDEAPHTDALAKTSSDGGPSDYYDFLPGWITLNDYIEHKSEQQWGADSFHLANITKAGCRWGDKEGTSKAYDAKKIMYSALRILRRIEGTQNVRVFLKELLGDRQFT